MERDYKLASKLAMRHKEVKEQAEMARLNQAQAIIKRIEAHEVEILDCFEDDIVGYFSGAAEKEYKFPTLIVRYYEYNNKLYLTLSDSSFRKGCDAILKHIPVIPNSNVRKYVAQWVKENFAQYLKSRINGLGIDVNAPIPCRSEGELFAMTINE